MRGRILSAGIVLLAIAVVPGPARAQHITVDGRLSAARTLAGPNYAITPDLGRQVGGNLFHSFGTFGLATGETATFSGPASVTNIIGRVTGGSASSIDGTIASTVAGANVYLINPAGIVFGPNAKTNVSGSFHASTADYLKMSDGSRYQATNPGGSTLTAASPAAFGFTSVSPHAITLSGSTLGPVKGTLGIVGGAVTVTGAALLAPAGTVHVAAVSGPAEVPVDPRSGPPVAVTASGQPSGAPATLGTISFGAGSTIDVSDPTGLGSGGSVFLRGGTVSLDGTQINAANYGTGGGQVLLYGGYQVSLTGSTSVQAMTRSTGSGAGVTIATAAGGTMTLDASSVAVGSTTAAEGGALQISGGALSIQDGASLTSAAQGSGAGGAIGLALSGNLSMTNGTIASSTAAAGAGAGVSIVVGGTAYLAAGSAIGTSTAGGGPGGYVVVNVAAGLTLDGTQPVASPTQISTEVNAGSRGVGGTVAVNTGTLQILGNAQISSSTLGRGSAGDVAVAVAGTLSIDGRGMGGGIFSSSASAATGNAGGVTVQAAAIGATNTALISSDTFGRGNAGDVSVSAPGAISIDGSGAPGFTGIRSEVAGGTAFGDGGNVMVSAGSLTLMAGGLVSTAISGRGAAGALVVSVAGDITIDGTGQASSHDTGIEADTDAAIGGAAGNVSVTAGGNISILGGGDVYSATDISSETFGRGAAGDLTVVASGDITVDGSQSAGSTAIDSDASSTGNAGTTTVSATNISLRGTGEITSSTYGPGNAGAVRVTTTGELSIGGGGQTSALTGVFSTSETGSTGNAGDAVVQAGSIAITGGGVIAAYTHGTGAGGNVAVAVTGALTIDGSAAPSLTTGIVAATYASSGGDAGQIAISAGSIALTGTGEISTSTYGSGNAGTVSVTTTGQLSIDGTGATFVTGITSETNPGSTGNAGDTVVHAGSVSIMAGGQISSSTLGLGAGGNVAVNVAAGLTIDGSGAPPNTTTGVTTSSYETDSGNSGQIAVSANSIAIAHEGEITSSTFGQGNAGTVRVTTTGQLSIDGTGETYLTGISSQTDTGSTGNAGDTVVQAANISIIASGVISSSTLGLGAGGNVTVNVAGALTIDGSGATSNNATGVIAATYAIGAGNGGQIAVSAGSIAIAGGGVISTSSHGSGLAGGINVMTGGALVIDSATVPAGAGIYSNAYAGGNAGDVSVQAGSVTLAAAGQIETIASGTGAGGAVQVTTPGALALNGAGQGNAPGETTGIAASATGPLAGQAGTVTVSAASVTISNGAQIASSTAGAGAGGDVVVTAGDMVLSGAGPEIFVGSTGSGDAGSISITAANLSLNGGASISTQANTANGGSIVLAIGNLLYLAHSGISTTVLGANGNGGNITIDPAFIVLDDGYIEANALAGHGGNVSITVGELLRTPDSAITATSQLGISGVIAISGLQPDLSGSLVVLASDLRAPAVLLDESCAEGERSGRSHLLASGRGSTHRELETTLSSLYIADRLPLDGGVRTGAMAPSTTQTNLSVAMPCK